MNGKRKQISQFQKCVQTQLLGGFELKDNQKSSDYQ